IFTSISSFSIPGSSTFATISSFSSYKSTAGADRPMALVGHHRSSIMGRSRLPKKSSNIRSISLSQRAISENGRQGTTAFLSFSLPLSSRAIKNPPFLNTSYQKHLLCQPGAETGFENCCTFCRSLFFRELLLRVSAKNRRSGRKAAKKFLFSRQKNAVFIKDTFTGTNLAPIKYPLPSAEIKAEFIHYVERVYAAAKKPAEGHFPESQRPVAHKD